MPEGLRNYLVVTASYWAFTVTDGAIRMLVVLYFFQRGYTPIEIAFLFLFYEFFGVVTNLLGGWIASRIGLNVTMHLGMGLQIIALAMLTAPEFLLTVPYVMAAQALSGIAKDLNKMSAKASVKLMLPKDAHGRLFKWVAVLTGSKNALKGLGFFVGGGLLSLVGFRYALLILAAGLLPVLLGSIILLPHKLGSSQAKVKFRQLFSRSRNINWLSAARFFLFGSRDVWFVVGLPVYFASQLDWDNTQVGGFLALWVIGYGIAQASVPTLLRKHSGTHGPDAATARFWVFVLALMPAGIALGLMADLDPTIILVVGLGLFALVFAINSAIHSFLVLAYSGHDHVAANVGFYYMANAGGRLAGTVLSGWTYQQWGLVGCLWWSMGFVLLAGLLSLKLSTRKKRGR
ncbi:MFS-type efflux pump ArsJ specific for 1-arseno-3-phosphoglycerate [hydrothermal vent metagenome]|uniref:MFS-type efflux pump ArsJ specific for 1-arseno-3-phosphoglycerate n=1 Tax=hydrothermal vent metagenome TaxID=652676 RepID=A0A3B0YXK8_9ZZZZ